jgi:hypothetical protein
MRKGGEIDMDLDVAALEMLPGGEPEGLQKCTITCADTCSSTCKDTG